MVSRLESVQTAGLAVFGGDTNLREAEVKAEKRVRGSATGKAGGTCSVLDGWVAAGSDAGTRFTWDLQLNDNKSFGGYFKPRARYDRFFISGSPAAAEKAKNNVFTAAARSRPVDGVVGGEGLTLSGVERFGLIGIEQMSLGYFPSDHFAIDMCLGVRLPPGVEAGGIGETAAKRQEEDGRELAAPGRRSHDVSLADCDAARGGAGRAGGAARGEDSELARAIALSLQGDQGAFVF